MHVARGSLLLKEPRILCVSSGDREEEKAGRGAVRGVRLFHANLPGTLVSKNLSIGTAIFRFPTPRVSLLNGKPGSFFF